MILELWKGGSILLFSLVVTRSVALECGEGQVRRSVEPHLVVCPWANKQPAVISLQKNVTTLLQPRTLSKNFITGSEFSLAFDIMPTNRPKGPVKMFVQILLQELETP